MATTPNYARPEQAAAMKGKKVLVISHSKWNPNGLPAAAVANIKAYNGFFKENGVIVYLATPNDDSDLTYKAYKDNDLIDGVVVVPGMYEDDGGKQIAAAVKKSGIQLDGVFSHFEMLQPVVGEVSELLGIKHNPYKAYMAARDKYLTRQALEAAGVATPKSMPIGSVSEVPKAVEKLGFPMIIKPTSGAGSLGVYKAFNEDELKEGVERVLNDMAHIAYLSSNPGTQQEAPMVVYVTRKVYPGTQQEAPMVVEQLLIPKDFDGLPVGEFDVDLVVWDGKLKYGAVTDNWYPIKPYYLENGNTFPSLVPESVQQELIDYCHQCVLALGFYKGVFHMEAIYTEKGPMLIECNPRVGGGPVTEFNRKLMGVELTHEHMMSTLNIPVEPRPKKVDKCMLVYYLNCPRTGTLEKADFWEFAKDDPEVLRTAYFVQDGQEVKGYDTQVPMWIGEIAMEGPVQDELRLTKKLLDIVAKATDAVKVTTQAPRRPSRRPSLLEGILAEEKEEFVDVGGEN